MVWERISKWTKEEVDEFEVRKVRIPSGCYKYPNIIIKLPHYQKFHEKLH